MLSEFTTKGRILLQKTLLKALNLPTKPLLILFEQKLQNLSADTIEKDVTPNLVASKKRTQKEIAPKEHLLVHLTKD